MAGIGGRVKSLMNTAGQADAILVIDGCALNCAKHTLAQAGFDTRHHLELQRLGFRKGSCPPTEQRLAATVQAGAELIKAIELEQEKMV